MGTRRGGRRSGGKRGGRGGRGRTAVGLEPQKKYELGGRRKYGKETKKKREYK